MLYNRVKEFRELHGLSQDELARRVGISPTVVFQLENEPGHAPRMTTAILLCKFFNVDLGRLFWIEGIAGRLPSQPEAEQVPA